MANVYLASIYDPDVALVDKVRDAAQKDEIGRHTLAEDPAEADVILFVEADPGRPFYERVIRHPLARRYPARCFLYTRTDHPLAVMQGIYVSVQRRGYDPEWMRSGVYIKATDWEPAEEQVPDPLLFSFVGATSAHPVRRRLLDLTGPGAVVEDTSQFSPFGDLPPEVQRHRRAHYADVGRRSRFILAPRGKGVSSIRLFEALRMGRPPVIISDEWVEPEGPDWSQISVRVRECDVGAIPHVLRALEPDAEVMGKRARQAWERWFSDRTIFDTMVTWCLSIAQQRRRPVPLLRGKACARTFEIVHAKHLARRVLRLPT